MACQRFCTLHVARRGVRWKGVCCISFNEGQFQAIILLNLVSFTMVLA
jgi:hypothetical protein